ncbi:MAG: cytochrome c/FTR1 family iron permease [Bacteroidota bacterium]|nr:cytochrome c/FTR1 family iron permease [Bacteroidota bacterium]
MPDKNKSSDHLTYQARTLINLLDYVSQDYAKAVNNGRVINKSEYGEMLDFTAQTVSLFDSIAMKISITNKKNISQQLSFLLTSIKQKSSKDLIATNARQIKKEILLLHLIDIFPEQYPDITAGRKLFQTSCQSCHGKNGEGDGPLSASFTPRPANLQDDSLMEHISPLQVFNTARLGVQGTGMPAFDGLSDKQLWQIAFYIKSLRFEKKYSGKKDTLEKIFKQIQTVISLSDVAHLSDKELENKLPGKNKEQIIAAIRLHHPTKNENNLLNIAKNYLDDALSLYKNNNSSDAEEKALYAYLDGIEPLEQQLTAIDANIVSELENKMNAVRSAIKSKKSLAEVEQKITEAKISINKASQLLGEQTYSFWFSFFIAASILLREGLEAVLIIITILSLLQSLKAKKAIRWVHGGWITAVAIGAASWFFTDWLISFGSQNREIIEGVGAIIAVSILMYVGFWLHNKTEAKKWQHFIHTRITSLLNQEKMFGLAFISFIVVFREAFESILFLSSMQLQVDDNSRNGIWIGAVSAIIAVILLGFLLLRFAVRIPLRKLFQYSAIVIMILAVVLTGQGVHAFQESGWLSVTSIPFNFRVEILGIFPTAETYGAQIIVGIMVFLMWYKRKKSVIE